MATANWLIFGSSGLFIGALTGSRPSILLLDALRLTKKFHPLALAPGPFAVPTSHNAFD
jgi:hypothetical protein